MVLKTVRGKRDEIGVDSPRRAPLEPEINLGRNGKRDNELKLSTLIFVSRHRISNLRGRKRLTDWILKTTVHICRVLSAMHGPMVFSLVERSFGVTKRVHICTAAAKIQNRNENHISKSWDLIRAGVAKNCFITELKKRTWAETSFMSPGKGPILGAQFSRNSNPLMTLWFLWFPNPLSECLP